MDSFTVATMNSKVKLHLHLLSAPAFSSTTGIRFHLCPPPPFSSRNAREQTSMSLIESTITKQLNLILLKRNTKHIAANLIYRCEHALCTRVMGIS